ncbi:flippase [Serratia quinivorans]|uniref:flippase n=1 Tax=Serratia quinivorans TaxID=137545 RepID=UPI001C467AF8|nr:flippase [Serratia quinivorans]MBV6693116.1 flippase [Serratia quinivorans]
MRAIFVNMSWLLLERISLILSGIFVSIYTARYFGPEKFGLLNYMLAIIAIVVPLVQLGADNILFNRIARNRNSGIRLMMASINFRRKIFLLVALPIQIWSSATQPPTLQIMMLVLLGSAYFSIQDVYKIYYDACLQSKLNTLINNIALLISIIVRVTLVSMKFPFSWFAIPYIISSALPYIIRSILFRRNKLSTTQFTNRVTRRYVSYLLHVGLPLAISGLSIAIYTRIDQIMLGNLIGKDAVGWYSAALTLSQCWTFIPLALITSLMPGIAECRASLEQETYIRILYSLVVILSLPILFLIIYNADTIVGLLYGPPFEPAAGIIYICALTSFLSVIGVITYRSIVLFSGYKFIAIKMLFVAMVNIAMNLLLIPRYGLSGAAASTLFAEFLSSIVLNIFFRHGKVLKLQLTCFRALPKIINVIRGFYVKSHGQ